MSPSVALWNVIGETVDIFLIGVIPLERGLHRDPFLFRREIKDAIKQRVLVFVEMLHKGPDAALVLEMIRFIRAFIVQPDGDTGIEERQFTQTLRQNLVMKLNVVEGLSAWLEMNGGPCRLGGANTFKRRLRNAVNVVLQVLLTASRYLKTQGLRQRIHHRYAHPMKAP